MSELKNEAEEPREPSITYTVTPPMGDHTSPEARRAIEALVRVASERLKADACPHCGGTGTVHGRHCPKCDGPSAPNPASELWGCFECGSENGVPILPCCVLDGGDVAECKLAERLTAEGKGKTDCPKWRNYSIAASDANAVAFHLEVLSSRMEGRVDAIRERGLESVGISAMFAREIKRTLDKGTEVLRRQSAELAQMKQAHAATERNACNMASIANQERKRAQDYCEERDAANAIIEELQGQIATGGICFDRVVKQRDDFRAQAERADEELAALKAKVAVAVKPFDIAVFNDNGDVTITTSHLEPGDWVRLSRLAALVSEA